MSFQIMHSIVSPSLCMPFVSLHNSVRNRNALMLHDRSVYQANIKITVLLLLISMLCCIVYIPKRSFTCYSLVLLRDIFMQLDSN